MGGSKDSKLERRVKLLERVIRILAERGPGPDVVAILDGEEAADDAGDEGTDPGEST